MWFRFRSRVLNPPFRNGRRTVRAYIFKRRQRRWRGFQIIDRSLNKQRRPGEYESGQPANNDHDRAQQNEIVKWRVQGFRFNASFVSQIKITKRNLSYLKWRNWNINSSRNAITLWNSRSISLFIQTSCTCMNFNASLYCDSAKK